MNIEFSKALLMSGKDFQITPSITLHHPSIGEILSINNSTCPDQTYWMYVQLILSDPYANMVMLDDMGKNYLDSSPYEVFILQWDSYRKNYDEYKEVYDRYGSNPLNDISNALQFFIKEKHEFKKGTYEDGTVCFYDMDDPACQIDQDIFDCICEWVKGINKIDYSEQIKPADESARRVLIEDMRDELKKAKKRRKKGKGAHDNDYLGNIMSAVIFCGNGSITPFKINDCKVYWLNESLAISGKKSNTDHILDGIYHGTIRSSDISKKELNWMK